jgi:hypothetical protein
MKSCKHGRRTSDVEVTNVDKHGLWLLVKGREHFLPYADFPWFRTAPAAKVRQVDLLHGAHLYWPALDVDLSLESLDCPRKYPMVAEG